MSVLQGLGGLGYNKRQKSGSWKTALVMLLFLSLGRAMRAIITDVLASGREMA